MADDSPLCKRHCAHCGMHADPEEPDWDLLLADKYLSPTTVLLVPRTDPAGGQRILLKDLQLAAPNMVQALRDCGAKLPFRLPVPLSGQSLAAFVSMCGPEEYLDKNLPVEVSSSCLLPAVCCMRLYAASHPSPAVHLQVVLQLADFLHSQDASKILWTDIGDYLMESQNVSLDDALLFTRWPQLAAALLRDLCALWTSTRAVPLVESKGSFVLRMLTEGAQEDLPGMVAAYCIAGGCSG